jgi:hypothetical protein
MTHHPNDGDSNHLRDFGSLLQDYRAWYSKRPSSSIKKPKIKQSQNIRMESQGGEDVQLLLMHDLGTIWVWVISVTPRPRFTPEVKISGVGQEAGWAPELVWTQEVRGKILFPLPRIEPRSPSRPVRSQTLYRLLRRPTYSMHTLSTKHYGLKFLTKLYDNNIYVHSYIFNQ